jgi:hypothetical protein
MQVLGHYHHAQRKAATQNAPSAWKRMGRKWRLESNAQAGLWCLRCAVLSGLFSWASGAKQACSDNGERRKRWRIHVLTKSCIGNERKVLTFPGLSGGEELYSLYGRPVKRFPEQPNFSF